MKITKMHGLGNDFILIDNRDKSITNENELAAKLCEMCENEVLVNDLKSGAAEFILGKYNWNDVATETCELYEKVASK